MGRGIDQRALVMLAVNFHQRGAHGFQGLHADRLVVDEGAGAPVGQLHPAQDHLARILRTRVVEPVVLENFRGRMCLRYIEYRGDLALLHAVAHQAGIAAPAQRQRESIEQDGFAGAGFAGQHRKATGKLDIEPFDQDDVTDRQTRQHAGSVPDGVVRTYSSSRRESVKRSSQRSRLRLLDSPALILRSGLLAASRRIGHKRLASHPSRRRASARLLRDEG